MSRDHTQEAYDEYYSTGVDPTGGEIGPDFDPENQQYYDELDDEEKAFYAEESGRGGAASSQGVSFRDALDRLEALIDKRSAEIDALVKKKEAEEKLSAAVPNPSFGESPEGESKMTRWTLFLKVVSFIFLTAVFFLLFREC